MYYQNVRQTRERLPEPYVYITSLKTPNGGREGVVSEVETALAARMLVDGSAREATAEEIAAHLSECERLRAAAQEDELRNRLRVTLVNEPDIRLESGKADRGTRRS